MSALKKLSALKDKRLSTPTAKSFAAYLGESTDPAARLHASLTAATSRAAAASPTLGATAESLAAAGLTNSGYADYLAASARDAKDRATDTAMATYLSDKNASVSGYGAYLDGLLKETAALEKSVLSYAKSNKLTDTAALKSYALSLGLSEKAAERTAVSAADTTRRLMRETVLKTVISRDMGEAQARIYALAQGLDEATAIKIGQVAKTMREAVLEDIDLPSIFGD